MVHLLEQLFSVNWQLYGRRRVRPGNEEGALLLIYLRKEIGRTLVLLYLVLRKVFCKIINWCSV